MRVIDAATLAQLDAGAIVVQRGIVLDFPSGTYAFWTGAGPYSWNGLTFLSGASLIDIDDPRETDGMEAVALTARLRAIPNSDLTPDVLATIDDEDFSQRPVSLYSLFFHPDTGAELSVEIDFRGYLDEIVHEAGADGAYELRAMLESRARDYTRRGTRMRSNKDQQLLADGDTFYRYAARHPREKFYWGMDEPALKKGGRRKKRKRR